MRREGALVVIGLWVERRGVAGSGRWHKVGDRVHLAETAEKVLEVLKDGYDGAFSYTPKEFDGSVPVQPTRPAPPPGAARGFMHGVRLRFRDDYTVEKGIRDAKPGDCFYVPCYRGQDGTQPCPEWDDCDGRHLYVVCPDGHWWNIDGRASNCGEGSDTPEKRQAWKTNRTHRCWVRSGSPEMGNITVGKGPGATCPAGAGSIMTGTYHGMLTDGVFNP